MGYEALQSFILNTKKKTLDRTSLNKLPFLI
jgi:hypothetical protein